VVVRGVSPVEEGSLWWKGFCETGRFKPRSSEIVRGYDDNSG